LEAELLLSCPGAWKNFDDLEENLCLQEINILLETARERKDQELSFLAMLQGIDLDKHRQKQGKTFEDLQEEARAKVLGVSAEMVALSEDFVIIDEEED
jgi:hypothetical protein